MIHNTKSPLTTFKLTISGVNSGPRFSERIPCTQDAPSEPSTACKINGHLSIINPLSPRALEPRTFALPNPHARGLDIPQRLPKRHPFLLLALLLALRGRVLVDLASAVRQVTVVVQRVDDDGEGEEVFAAFVKGVEVLSDAVREGIGEGDVEGLEGAGEIGEEFRVGGQAAEAEVEKMGEEGEHDGEVG